MKFEYGGTCEVCRVAVELKSGRGMTFVLPGGPFPSVGDTVNTPEPATVVDVRTERALILRGGK